MHVAILEDEKSLSDELRILLNSNGHDVSIFVDGHKLLKALNTHTFDLFILDWKVPIMDGYEVLHHLRSELKLKEPIIFLTSNDTESDIVKAFDFGADDYCIKPLRPTELMARLNALIRRAYYHQDKKLIGVENLSSYVFNSVDHSVTFDDRSVVLTDKEFLLAYYFFSNIDRPLSRQHLMMRVWGRDVDGFTRTLDVHIAWIRSKLQIGAKANRVRLIAIHGFGYRLVQLEH